MHLAASSKTRNKVCTYEKVCTFKKVALNNPSLWQTLTIATLNVSPPPCLSLMQGALPQARFMRLRYMYSIAEKFHGTFAKPSYNISFQGMTNVEMSPYPLCNLENRRKKKVDKIFTNESRWWNWWKFSSGENFQLYSIYRISLKSRHTSKSRRPRGIFQLAHPNKHRPQNVAAWYGVDNYLRMRTIICAYII